jgi:BON domain
MRHYPFLTMLIILFIPGWAQSGSNRQNWYHDPFFQISNAIPSCPKPAGPFVTEAERLTNAHHRAEQGTSCWLAGKCDRPTSYDYDQDIAKAFKQALKKENSFKDSTLWVTVQGRVVFIEGCVKEKGMSSKLERFASRLPYVDIAVAHVRADPTEEVPYVLFDDP